MLKKQQLMHSTRRSLLILQQKFMTNASAFAAHQGLTGVAKQAQWSSLLSLCCTFVFKVNPKSFSCSSVATIAISIFLISRGVTNVAMSEYMSQFSGEYSNYSGSSKCALL